MSGHKTEIRSIWEVAIDGTGNLPNLATTNGVQAMLASQDGKTLKEILQDSLLVFAADMRQQQAERDGRQAQRALRAALRAAPLPTAAAEEGAWF